ncbi:hypothetical protein EVA_13898 [gut metagenome]|uniref:Uncharacterized protein n=1 Tax=gut metagenome TaxID=749906 RepID=J9CDE7_9ZZZZ
MEYAIGTPIARRPKSTIKIINRDCISILHCLLFFHNINDIQNRKNHI